MKDVSQARPLLFGVDDSPPPVTRFIAGLQHLMAIFGGIVTAPLVISRGMGLSAADSNYLITGALLISGVATAIQVLRIGPIGTGMLSVQGTSFTFIGAIIFAFFALPETMNDADKLGVIFGSAALAALSVLPVAWFIPKLYWIFTPTVAGTTVFLLGSSLVLNNLSGIVRDFQSAESSSTAFTGLALAVTVFVVTLVLSFSKSFWLRMTSIVLGFTAGFCIALALGMIDTSLLSELDTTFVPDPFHFGLGFEWSIYFILLPIFIVSITETMGDLTATSAISAQPTTGPLYWQRVRGGVMADAINSLVASIFATFPNTTFSQNNGVIRLTGIASPKVGLVTAGLLVLMGLFPVIGGVFQLLPNPVLAGATLLMFLMVALAGIEIIRRAGGVRNWGIAICGAIGGWLIPELVAVTDSLHPQVAMLLQFPVSTGAFLAIALQLLLPRTGFLASKPENAAF